MSWDRHQVTALAPDSASVKAAEKLSSSSKWPLLEHHALAVWGHCQGSGKKPYQTRIDLNGPAFKCSCPSRKFPCKHGLALFYLYVDQRDAFTAQEQLPAWVDDWIKNRHSRAEKQQVKASAEKPVDAKAQQKRLLQRQQKVDAGVEYLLTWLDDVVRVGLADLANKPYAYWEALAARMVDAQAGGLANQIRQIGNLAVQGADQMSSLVQKMAHLYLLLQGYRQLPHLPEPLQQDVKRQLGWSWSQDELLAQPPLQDRWLMLAQQQTLQDQLLQQTHWVLGLNSGQIAKQIQYVHESQRARLSLGWGIGQVAEAPLHFYPSSTPLRALIAQHQRVDGLSEGIGSVDPSPHGQTLTQALATYRQCLARNPWLEAMPLLLCSVSVLWRRDSQEMLVVDVSGCTLSEATDIPLLSVPMATHDIDEWQLLAVAGSDPVSLVAEWDGSALAPLGVWHQQHYWPLRTIEVVS